MESFENTDIEMENSLGEVAYAEGYINVDACMWGDSHSNNISLGVRERVITISMMVYVNGSKCVSKLKLQWHLLCLCSCLVLSRVYVVWWQLLWLIIWHVYLVWKDYSMCNGNSWLLIAMDFLKTVLVGYQACANENLC
jgi:hypothetical protein